MSLDIDIRVERAAFTLAARFAAPGGVTAVFGPSGAGKSMLLSAIAGLAPLSAGRVALGARVLEDKAAGVRVAPHARGVGMVFQDARLFPHLSVRGNLQYALKRAPAAKHSLEEAARYFDIAPLLDRAVRNLSGGEKSRVALARAILSQPELLLLDEPFAALDGARRRAFLDVLLDMHQRFDLPMLVVTHQIDDVVALADHIVGIKQGQVVASGPLAETAATPAFQALLDERDTGAAITVGAGRAWVRADHVLLSSVQPAGLSARHVWQVTVRELLREDERSVLVRAEAAAGPVFARITPEAAGELALSPGALAWAVVKAHSL